MSTFTKFQLACISAASIVALSGCSDQPSASDARVAIEKHMSEMAAEISVFTGSTDAAKVHDVKILGCVASEGSPGLNCDVEYSVISSDGNQTANAPITKTIRFVKSSDGWITRD